MKYIMVKPRFARMIALGNKTMTLRPVPKGGLRIRPGEDFQLRVWAGAPYRSKQRPVATARMVHAYTCTIDFDYHVAILVCLQTQEVAAYPLSVFAWHDGFQSEDDLREWFQREHGLEASFEGVLYTWHLLNGDPSIIPPCSSCWHGGKWGGMTCPLSSDCWNGVPYDPALDPSLCPGHPFNRSKHPGSPQSSLFDTKPIAKGSVAD